MFDSVVSVGKAVMAFLAASDFTGIILFMAMTIFAMTLWRLNKSESSKFFYDQLFTEKDGTASTSKLSHIVALILSSWAFIHLTLKGTLSEWYFLTYMSVWVLQRSYSKWIDMKSSEIDVKASEQPK